MQNGKKKAKVFNARLSADGRTEFRTPMPSTKKDRVGSVQVQSN